MRRWCRAALADFACLELAGPIARRKCRVRRYPRHDVGSAEDWRRQSSRLTGLSPGIARAESVNDAFQIQFLATISQDSCHGGWRDKHLTPRAFGSQRAENHLRLPLSAASRRPKKRQPSDQAGRSAGGAVGRIGAKATWTIPAVLPTATPIRQASV
jgi:hypothetical protein